MKQTPPNNIASDNFKLEVLSPLDKKDDPRVLKYLKHLKEALDNPEVKNLALTGVYGSGKSTIIKSLKSKYSDIRVLNISLASFKESDEDYKNFKDQLQLNILQQIIYSQKSEKLPKSRIKRINELNIWEERNWKTILSMFGLFFSAYILFNYYQYQFNPKNLYLSASCNNLINDISWSFLLLILLFILSVFSVGQVLMELLLNSRINKISLNNVNAELSKAEENKDVLNKYIDEIIYFFEKIPVDVVIIEDLDRFNTTEIYRTLREINFILNTYIQNSNIDKLNKITFLYAIKDDLFSNGLDRTKFFDLIIPTIPFVNFNNSKNVLKTKLNNIYDDGGRFVESNKYFINNVSSFITDNRILINIINEFAIYKNQREIENEELNPQKLLAIIIYKNLRPKDFSQLHHGLSNLDIMFSKKFKIGITKKIRDKKEEDKIKIQKDIETIRKEGVENIKDLNRIFLYHILIQAGNNINGLKINSQKKSLEHIINEAIDLRDFYDNTIEYYYQHSNYSLGKMSIIDKEVGYSYRDKYDLIINRNKYLLVKEEELLELRKKLNRIENLSLQELFDEEKDLTNFPKDNFTESFSVKLEEFEKVFNDELTLFLLQNGYIDEHYREYISIFQQGGLTEKDQEFKINIFSRIKDPKPFDYEVSNVEEIIEELQIKYFQDERILNFKLVDFVTSKKEKYSEQFQAILNLISQWNERSQNFVREYLDKGKEKQVFISELCKIWKDLWITISNPKSIFLDSDKRNLLMILFESGENGTIIELNRKNLLRDFISDRPDILIEFENDEKLQERIPVFSAIGIKFKDLSPIVSDKYNKQLKQIYENNLYEINYDNVGTVLENNLDDFNKEEFDTSNLTYIYESGQDILIEYISDKFFENYITNIYLKLSVNQKETEVHIKKIINEKNLILEKRIEFLKKQINVINDLNNINEDLYEAVFEYNKIKSDWNNVYSYFVERGNVFNDVLVNFLNLEENYIELSKTKIETAVDEENLDDFIIELLKIKRLNVETLKFLFTSFPDDYKLSVSNYKIFEKDKVELLIDNKIIDLNEENFEDIKENHSDLHIKLLIRDINDFLNFPYSIDSEDTVKVLKSKSMDVSSKYSIIKNYLIDKDFDFFEISKEVISLIIDNQHEAEDVIDKDKLKALLMHNFEGKTKLKLLNIYKKLLTIKTIIDIKASLPSPYNTDLIPKGQLLVDNDKDNLEFIRTLQDLKIAGEIKYNKSNTKIRVWLKLFKN